MFDPKSDDEREHNKNDEALLGWRKNKYRKQPLH